jgi:hypothetical protein
MIITLRTPSPTGIANRGTSFNPAPKLSFESGPQLHTQPLIAEMMIAQGIEIEE